MATDCQHLRDAAPDHTAVTPDGCEECLKSGEHWVELRLCVSCGHVGCCDSSPGTHATKHFEATGHPVMRSYRARSGDWRWCYVDKVMSGTAHPAAPPA